MSKKSLNQLQKRQKHIRLINALRQYSCNTDENNHFEEAPILSNIRQAQLQNM